MEVKLIAKCEITLTSSRLKLEFSKGDILTCKFDMAGVQFFIDGEWSRFFGYLGIEEYFGVYGQ